MTSLFPLPNHASLVIPEDGPMPQIPARALAQLLARRPVLANVTDQTISLAQFNCLMAQHAPAELKRHCLLHRSAMVLDDPLNGHTIGNGTKMAQLQPTGYWMFSHFLPLKNQEWAAPVHELIALTTNTVLCHMSQHGDPSAPTLPVKHRLRPQLTEEAAIHWADAMEAQLN